MAHSPFAALFGSRAAAAKGNAKGKAKKPGAEGDNADGDDDVREKMDEAQDDAEDDVGEPSKKITDDDDVDDEDLDREADAKKAKKKSAKAKAASDDDEDMDDDADMKKKAIRVQARADERQRITAIMTSDAAKANPEAALNIALTSPMSVTASIGLLHAIGPARPAQQVANTSAARERLAAVVVPDVGGQDEPPPTGAKGLAAQILAAGKKRRGEV